MSLQNIASRMAVTLACCVIFSAPAFASHTIFEYKVDRFEVTGNLPGYIFDEFDDGTIAPWGILFGTAAETGGYAILSNPGTHQPFPGYPNIILDRSDIVAPPAFQVRDGYGNFTATSTWAPVIPDLPGGFYAVYLHYQITPTLFEIVSVGVGNYSAAIQEEVSGPGPGLQFGQARWVYGAGTGVLAETDAYFFDPADLTGDVLFRLAFDDATNQVTASFSMDGGVTFQSPFTPMASSMTSEYPASWILIGDPASLVDAVPAARPSFLGILAGLLLALGPVGIAAARRRRS